MASGITGIGLAHLERLTCRVGGQSFKAVDLDDGEKDIQSVVADFLFEAVLHLRAKRSLDDGVVTVVDLNDLFEETDDKSASGTLTSTVDTTAKLGVEEVESVGADFLHE